MTTHDRAYILSGAVSFLTFVAMSGTRTLGRRESRLARELCRELRKEGHEPLLLVARATSAVTLPRIDEDRALSLVAALRRGGIAVLGAPRRTTSQAHSQSHA